MKKIKEGLIWIGVGIYIVVLITIIGLVLLTVVILSGVDYLIKRLKKK